MRVLRYAAEVGGIALLYFLSGLVGLVGYKSAFAMWIWFPAGLMLAALYLRGMRLWPGVMIGAFAIMHFGGWSATTATIVGLGTSAQAVLGVAALRAADFDPCLERFRDVRRLAVASLLSAGVVAIVASYALLLAGEFPASWTVPVLGYWMASACVSMLVVAPLVFAVNARVRRVTERGAGMPESLALAGFLVGLAFWAFFMRDVLLPRLGLPYLMFLPMIWAAIRFGVLGASLACMTTVLFVHAAIILVPERAPNVWVIQPYFAILSVTGLSIAAVVASHRRSERRKAAMLDGALDAIITIDSAGMIREVNHRVEELFGFTADELVGRELATTLIPEHLRDAHRAGMARYLHDGSSTVIGRRTRFPALRKNGRPLDVEISVVRVALPGPPVFTGFLRDVSSEVKAEETTRRAQEDLERQVKLRTAELREAIRALASQRDQQATAQQLAQVGSFDYELHSRHIECSEELCRIFGLDAARHPTYEDFLARIHPDDRAQFEQQLTTTVASRGSFTFEGRIISSDRGVRIVSSIGRVITDSFGRPVRLIGSCQDVTERRVAEEQRDRLSRIVEYSDDAIIGIDLESRIESWNAGAMKLFGYRAVDAIGRPASILVPSDAAAEQRERLAAVARGAHVAEFQSCHVRADGTRFEAAVTTSPIRSAMGKITGVSKVVRDVSQRVAVEAQLRSSLREKEVLLREIHHRVKNNLQVITSFLNLQLAKLKSEDARQAVTDSQSRIQSMALVHQLLYQSPDFSSIDFTEYLRAIADRLHRTYRPTNSVRVDVARSDIRLDVDHAIPCGLIVNELLANAFTHAFPDNRSGHVSISLLADGDNYVLTVEDDGIGIPEGFSIDNVKSFGLKIARTLSQQLQGTFSMERHHGTRVRVVFPAPPAADQRPSANAAIAV